MYTCGNTVRVLCGSPSILGSGRRKLVSLISVTCITIYYTAVYCFSKICLPIIVWGQIFVTALGRFFDVFQVGRCVSRMYCARGAEPPVSRHFYAYFTRSFPENYRKSFTTRTEYVIKLFILHEKQTHFICRFVILGHLSAIRISAQIKWLGPNDYDV